MTNGERLSEVDKFNRENASLVSERAEQVRVETIRLAYEAMNIHLEADKVAFEDLEERGFPDGEQVRRFVLEDMRAAPLQEGEIPQTTFSLTLMPRILREDAELLRIHIPVPEGLEIQDYEMPPIDEVTRIFLAYEQPGTLPRRYVIDRNYMYQYTSAADAGEEELLGSSREIMLRAQTELRTDETIVLAQQAQLDIIEMTVIPQRINSVGEDDILDV